MKVQKLDRALILTSIIGVLVSTYALHVEMAMEVHSDYTAMCDIGEYASCSRVLTSKYSKGFGLMPDDSTLKIPNCIYGIIFYCLMIFFSTFEQRLVVQVQLLAAAASVASSVYLAYLLAFVLHDFCIVCVSTYIVNGFLVYFTWKKIKCLDIKIIKNK